MKLILFLAIYFFTFHTSDCAFFEPVRLFAYIVNSLFFVYILLKTLFAYIVNLCYFCSVLN